MVQIQFLRKGVGGGGGECDNGAEEKPKGKLYSKLRCDTLFKQFLIWMGEKKYQQFYFVQCFLLVIVLNSFSFRTLQLTRFCIQYTNF